MSTSPYDRNKKYPAIRTEPGITEVCLRLCKSLRVEGEFGREKRRLDTEDQPRGLRPDVAHLKRLDAPEARKVVNEVGIGLEKRLSIGERELLDG